MEPTLDRKTFSRWQADAVNCHKILYYLKSLELNKAVLQF